jgi:hypothetical protein
LGCEPFQIARALTGEWPIEMALENSRIGEESLEHGVHLQAEGTTNAAELCGQVVGEEAETPAP